MPNQMGDWRDARVLIIDDEPLICRVVKKHLIASGISDVDYIRDPIYAIEKTTEFLPDLVLLDIMMPIMSGLEVLKLLRDFDPQILVVMLSGADMDTKYKALELGACDFVNKPVNPKELRVRIRHVLNRSFSRAKSQ
jgi:DNA-binding response OmpR family regulator